MNRWLMTTSPPASRLRGEVDRLVSDALGDLLSDRARRGRAGTQGRSFPAVNVWEDEGKLYAEAEVPGLKLDDLDILVKGNELTIKGERKAAEREGVKVHRRERGTGSFCGVVRLPVEVDTEKVEASLESGVLTVSLPKAASARARKIKVKALNS